MADAAPRWTFELKRIPGADSFYRVQLIGLREGAPPRLRREHHVTDIRLIENFLAAVPAEGIQVGGS